MKILLAAIAFLATHFVNAQCSESSYRKPFEAKVITHEVDSLDGIFSVEIEITAFQDIVFKDSIDVISTSWIEIVPPSSPYGEGNLISIDSGNSITLNYSFSYDTANLPFYPKEIEFISLDTNIPYLSARRLASAHIYFTPWNTVEVFDFHDFISCKRNWLVGSDSAAPDRIYLDKSTLPVTDMPDSLADDDSSMVYSWRTEGLAFSIPFLEPDTFGYDSVDLLINQQLMKKADGCGFWAHGFWGRIVNTRIVSINDVEGNNARQVPIGLRNATVEICINRSPFQVITTCRTDEEGYITQNGSRTINFEFCRNLNKSYADIFIRVKLHDYNHWKNFKVEYKGIGQNYHQWETSGSRLHRNGGNRVTVTFGTPTNGENWIFPGEHNLTRTYTWFRSAFDLSKAQMGSKGDRIDDFNCKIITKTDRILKLDPDIAQYRGWSSNTIVLGINVVRTHNTENTHYHEFGHFFTDMIVQNDYVIWQESGGTHVWNWNNRHPHVTMSEGLANGFAFIMDQMTWAALDQESNRNIGGEELHPRINFGNAANRRDNLTTPLLSEWIIAQTVLDLWDGPNNFTTFGNTETSDFYNDFNNDNYEIPFATIFRPLWDRKFDINDYPMYFQSLSEFIPSENKRAFKEIIDYNMSDGNINNAFVIPEDYLIMNTDIIKRHRDIDQRFISTELNTDGTGRIGAINHENFNYETCDVGLLTGDILSFNACDYKRQSDISPFDEVYPMYGKYDLTDDIRVENSASLKINSEDDLGFYNGGLFRDYWYDKINTTQVTYNVYSSLVEIATNGNLIMGSASGNIGNFVFKNASELFLSGNSTNPSVLRINNNSTLVIDVGATLRIGPGTQIILDGPNAILEIRGTLILENGASLAPVGGNNGLGFVRFNMPGIWTTAEAQNRIQLGAYSSIVFNGNTNYQKVMEVANVYFWLVNTGTNPRFLVNSGMIAMGSDAHLNLGVRSNFNHVRIVPTNSNFKCVYFWGYQHSIWDLKVIGSERGIVCFNNVGRWPFMATNLELQGCGKGLRIEGRGTGLSNLLIENGSNDIGLNIIGAEISSVLSAPTIRDVTIGTQFTGSSAAPLSLAGANYSVSEKAIDFNAPSSLFSRCGQFTGDDQGVGFNVAGGRLEISNAFGREGGGNIFNGNNVTTDNAFSQTLRLLKAPIYMDGGINNLRFAATGSSPMALIGRTRDVVSATGFFSADDNYWDNTPNAAPSTIVNWPNTYQNYNLIYPKSGGPVPWDWAQVAVGTTFYSSLSTYNSDRGNLCNGSLWGYRGGPSTALPANPRNITYSGAPFQNVKDVFEDILVRQYDSVQAGNIVPDWELALTATEWNTSMTATDYVYIDIGLAKMNELVGDYLLNDSAFLSNPDSTYGIVASLKNTINHWIARCDTATAWQAVQLLDYLKFQKAGLYFLVNDYSKANTIYSELAANADSSLAPLAEFWVCQIDRVQRIKERPTDCIFLDSLPECSVTYPESYPEPFLNKLPKEIDKVLPLPIIRPNPANTFLSLSLNGSEFDKIEIVSSMGQKVYENTIIKTGKDDYTFDISGLSEGLYMVTLIDSKDLSKFTKKIVVAR
jgi:hypothetical protein